MMLNQAVATNSSPVQKIEKIAEGWDFSSVREYLQFEEKLPERQVLDIEREYKRFMSVMVGERQFHQMPISAEVDKFWHAHILFTRDYTAFSHAIAGECIHHYPTASNSERNELQEAYSRVTLPGMRKHFGELDESLWPQGAQVCIGGISAPSERGRR